MYNSFFTDLKILYYAFLDTCFQFFVDKILPRKIIFSIADQNLHFVASTVPAVYLINEMRRRGLVEYFCWLHMILYATSGEYSDQIVSGVTVYEVLTRYQKSIRKK